MRTKDKDKPVLSKASRTVNFDKVILEELEDKARKENTTVSHLVNHICRQQLLTNATYFRFMAKHHQIEFQKYNYLKEEAEKHNE